MTWLWALLPALAWAHPHPEPRKRGAEATPALVGVGLPKPLRVAGPSRGPWPIDAEIWADEPGFHDTERLPGEAPAEPPADGATTTEASAPAPPAGVPVPAVDRQALRRARTEAGVWVGVGSGLVASGVALLLIPDARLPGTGCELQVRCFSVDDLMPRLGLFGAGALSFCIAAAAGRPRPAPGSAQHRAWLQWGLLPQ